MKGAIGGAMVSCCLFLAAATDMASIRLRIHQQLLQLHKKLREGLLVEGLFASFHIPVKS